MDIEWIITDLDQTLLRTDKTISAYTVEVLQKCREAGIKVAFATVRSENASRRMIEAVKPDAVISDGGAVARMGQKEFYRATITPADVNALLGKLLQIPGVGYITVDTDRGYFVNKPADENDPVWKDFLPVTLTDFSKGLNNDAYKINAEIPDKKAAYAVAAGLPGITVIPFFGENWYCFAAKGADKWSGVRALAAHTGADIQKIAAFGDDYSDIEMLKNCGTGVAMANAIDEVKAVADETAAANDNDGVAVWVEAHCL